MGHKPKMKQPHQRTDRDSYPALPLVLDIAPKLWQAKRRWWNNAKVRKRARDKMGQSNNNGVSAPSSEGKNESEGLRKAVEGLRELRQIAGKGQADIASALNIKQPSVSKIEKQSDMYLSTLRSYVEAVGGKLELTVKLPKLPALRIHHLGDHTAAKTRVGGRGAASTARRRHG